MPFQDVPAKVDDYAKQEHEVLQLWKDTNAFQTLRTLHAGQPKWSFLDGPVTANNPLGVHHGWGRTYKDVFNRFWTMRGRELRYQNGFDCQGLWVEVEVEKELGFRSKRDIETYGLDAFVRKCKERVLRFAAVQTEQSIRLGYWMDWNDPGHLRDLATGLMENPSRRMTVQGPRGEVTDTVEQTGRALGHAGPRRQLLHVLEREQLHDLDLPQAVLAARLALPRRRRDAVVLALRHRHQPARDRHRRVSGTHPHLHHPAPAVARAASGNPCWCGPRRLGRCPATWWPRLARNSPTSR